MASLFRSKDPGKADLPRQAKELLPRWREDPPQVKAVEKVPEILAQMKATLQGTHEQGIIPQDVADLVSAILSHDLLLELAETIHLFPFEARKDTQIIFSCTIRYNSSRHTDPDSFPPAIHYILTQRPEVIHALCKGYEHKASAVPCGIMLREALKQEDIAVLILYDEPPKRFDISEVDDTQPSNGCGLLWQFFGWVEAGAFEISADAFTTFREILTKHKSLVVHWLDINFDTFFTRYADVLMRSSSYVTKRQSIKLLGEILLERTNYPIMTRYVDNVDYLKVCMNLLRDDRKMVQYEGFHVFKVFIANPNKSYPIQKILINNKEKMLKFLPNFLAERKDDTQFRDEKMFLIRQIEMLPPEPAEPQC